MIIKIGNNEYCLEGYAYEGALRKVLTEAYRQGRADFVKEHTQINAYGKPFILISSDEYEQLKEQANE